MKRYSKIIRKNLKLHCITDIWMISRVLFYAPVAKGRIYKTYVYGIELLILMSSKKSKLQNLMNLSVT